MQAASGSDITPENGNYDVVQGCWFSVTANVNGVMAGNSVDDPIGLTAVGAPSAEGNTIYGNKGGYGFYVKAYTSNDSFIGDGETFCGTGVYISARTDEINFADDLIGGNAQNGAVDNGNENTFQGDYFSKNGGDGLMGNGYQPEVAKCWFCYNGASGIELSQGSSSTEITGNQIQCNADNGILISDQWL